MRKLWIVLLMLMLWLPTQAQSTWEAAFYVELRSDPYTADLRLLNSDGQVTIIPIPASISQGANAQNRQVLVSDDRRYLVLSETQIDPYTALPLRIADLQAGTCCIQISPLPNTDAFAFAGFEPNGSRFAFSYVGSDPANSTPFTGGLMVVDAATGGIVSNVLMRDAALATGMNENAAWARMGTWELDGIRFADNCYGCEGRFEGQYALWQPDTGGFAPNPGISFSDFGTRLDATGEFLLLVQNQAFSFDPSEGFFPVSNAVHYTPANGNVDFTTGQAMPAAPVVYHNLDALALDDVQWVGDGQAFIVTPANTNFQDVVYRDGHVERIQADFSVLGGTPAGWLEQVTDAGGGSSVLHHALDGTRTPIFSVGGGVVIRLIAPPDLGQNLPNIVPTFIPINAPSADALATMQAQTVTQCPGFLASRLVVGRQGQVTPGAPNRMRRDPNTNGAIVGQIPGEGVFAVLSGPVCDAANGIAWWQVEYEGLVGWTAEGQSGDYWTQPFNR